METSERASAIMERLAGLYPDAHTMLRYDGPFQLLISVILSAQTTDAGVNKVTPALFESFPDARSLASADPAAVEELIRPTGFFRNKTKAIMGAARMITAEYDGEVPDTMDDLVRLPGVARKTANIVISNAFGKIEGIAVDTHVFRLAHRFGLSAEKDPDKVERDLMGLFPRDEWFHINYRFIDHGRAVCTAKRPACGACALSDLCPSAFTVAGWRDTV
ncbi:MAG TPA: endonuclease III [Coriobacteriia bacterium]|nr:endonuclease III [Coriobacteriia bacterium]